MNGVQNSSTVNFGKGATVANATTVAVGQTSGTGIDLYNGSPGRSSWSSTSTATTPDAYARDVHANHDTLSRRPGRTDQSPNTKPPERLVPTGRTLADTALDS